MWTHRTSKAPSPRIARGHGIGRRRGLECARGANRLRASEGGRCKWLEAARQLPGRRAGEGPGASGLRSWGALGTGMVSWWQALTRRRALPLASERTALRRVLLRRRRAATAAAGRPATTGVYAARGYRGRGLPRELKLCVAKPAGARAAWARAALSSWPGAVRPGSGRAGVRLYLLCR